MIDGVTMVIKKDENNYVLRNGTNGKEVGCKVVSLNFVLF